MQLVSNHGTLAHRPAISQVIEGSETVTVAVAFLKFEGAKFLVSLLKPVLANGGCVTAFIGTDFCLTEPDALNALLKLAERHAALRIYVSRAGAATFHPKVYSGICQGRFRCLVGSANLTGGALKSNEEMSLLFEAEQGSDVQLNLEEEWRRLLKGKQVQRLDWLVLAQYRQRCELVKRAREKLDEALGQTDQILFNLDQIKALLAEYRADPMAMKDLHDRKINRTEACKLQNAIANIKIRSRMSATDRKAFQTHLKNLMTGRGGALHLWPSDAIFRRGTRTLDQPREMIELFRVGREAALLPVEAGYDRMRDAAQDIQGAGLNMVTEILSTYAPKRYAVLNGNTVGALRHLGLDAPNKPSTGSLRGARYSQIVSTIGALRDRISAADFPETDAFLNWLYQKLE